MLVTCNECGGKGEVEVEHISPMSFSSSWGDIYTTWDTCELCDGNGEIEQELD